MLILNVANWGACRRGAKVLFRCALSFLVFGLACAPGSRSDDATSDRERDFHERAARLIEAAAQADGISKLGGTGFRVMRNPDGDGCFVYFHRAIRPAVWWVLRTGEAYPLNSGAKIVTPKLPWPHEHGVQAPAIPTPPKS